MVLTNLTSKIVSILAEGGHFSYFALKTSISTTCVLRYSKEIKMRTGKSYNNYRNPLLRGWNSGFLLIKAFSCVVRKTNVTNKILWGI